MKRAGVAAVLAVAALGGCAEDSPQSCKVETLADLPLLAGRRMPMVEATLNGQQVALLIDTGAATSVITKNAAERFHLFGSDGRLVTLNGIGGSVYARMVTTHRLGLGHGTARDIDLPVAGDFGAAVQGMPLLGLFGADFLSNYDVDIDMPARHFALYALQHCPGSIPPFDPPYFEVPFRLDQTRIKLELKLNDHPITAMLDSGAAITTITREDAREAGVTREALIADRQGHGIGIDENPVAARLHRFGSLEVSAERMRNFPFSVADLQTRYSLLGDDFLHFNRVWISYWRERVYIQPSLSNAIVHVAAPATGAATER